MEEMTRYCKARFQRTSRHGPYRASQPQCFRLVDLAQSLSGERRLWMALAGQSFRMVVSCHCFCGLDRTG